MEKKKENQIPDCATSIDRKGKEVSLANFLPWQLLPP